MQDTDIIIAVDLDDRHLPFGNGGIVVKVDGVEGDAAGGGGGFVRGFGGGPPGRVPGVTLGQEKLFEGVARSFPGLPVFDEIEAGEDGRRKQHQHSQREDEVAAEAAASSAPFSGHDGYCRAWF